jgi:hypothetical protein
MLMQVHRVAQVDFDKSLTLFRNELWQMANIPNLEVQSNDQVTIGIEPRKWMANLQYA